MYFLVSTNKYERSNLSKVDYLLFLQNSDLHLNLVWHMLWVLASCFIILHCDEISHISATFYIFYRNMLFLSHKRVGPDFQTTRRVWLYQATSIRQYIYRICICSGLESAEHNPLCYVNIISVLLVWSGWRWWGCHLPKLRRDGSLRQSCGDNYWLSCCRTSLWIMWTGYSWMFW